MSISVIYHYFNEWFFEGGNWILVILNILCLVASVVFLLLWVISKKPLFKKCFVCFVSIRFFFFVFMRRCFLIVPWILLLLVRSKRIKLQPILLAAISVVGVALWIYRSHNLFYAVDFVWFVPMLAEELRGYAKDHKSKGKETPEEKLIDLNSRYEKGLISLETYQAQRAEILRQLSLSSK